MKLNKRHKSTILFISALFLTSIFIGVVSNAQSLEGYVVEGESFGSIRIGESTADDVIATYGADYKLINHNQYSYEMIYKNLGLSFYYCQADPKKEIFVVEIEPPFRATTKSGIVLGESTIADVFRIYGDTGETSSGFEYDGVYFYAEVDNEDEEMEDARNQPQIVENVKNQSDESNDSVTGGGTGSENPFIIDAEEVRNVNTGILNGGNTENNSSTQTVQADENVQESEKERALKAKVVKRIELIEKNDLRQCDSKFPGN